MEDTSELILAINPELSINLPEHITLQQLHDELARYINQLITKNFEKLINLLYRLDVSEQKLKELLLESKTEEAGKIIADLIIKRQLEKIKTRKEAKSNNDIPDDEKW